MSVNVPKVPLPAIGMLSSLETRVVMARLLLGVVIGVCIGALIGGLAVGALASDSTATAFLRLQNPADLTAIAGGANQITPDNQDNTSKFVAGEIAYLSGEGFAQAVARKMAMDKPAELNVAQASESAVVSVSYTASSSDEAIRTVQTAIDLYRQQLSERVDRQLRLILPTLSEWQQRDAVDPVRMQELQRVSESVQLQAAEASTLLVVQPPTPNHPSSKRWVIGVVLGGLIGGACLVAVMLARRRRSGRGSLVETVADAVDGVLLPAVDLDATSRDDRADDRLRLARTLYSQCPSTGPTRVLLVAGASPSSGSSTIAKLLAIAATEKQPAASVAPMPGQHSLPDSLPAPTERHTTRVISGGVVGDPALTSDAIHAATDIVLVLRIGQDSAAQALALRSATASSTAPVVAVFTYRGLWAGFRRTPTKVGVPVTSQDSNRASAQRSNT